MAVHQIPPELLRPAPRPVQMKWSAMAAAVFFLILIATPPTSMGWVEHVRRQNETALETRGVVTTAHFDRVIQIDRYGRGRKPYTNRIAYSFDAGSGESRQFVTGTAWVTDAFAYRLLTERSFPVTYDSRDPALSEPNSPEALHPRPMSAASLTALAAIYSGFLLTMTGVLAFRMRREMRLLTRGVATPAILVSVDRRTTAKGWRYLEVGYQFVDQENRPRAGRTRFDGGMNKDGVPENAAARDAIAAPTALFDPANSDQSALYPSFKVFELRET